MIARISDASRHISDSELMHEFRVWAPKASSVDVQYGDGICAMRRCPRGWWQASVEAAGPGSEYAFSIDGGEPLPDPRSPFQPHGVHGRSCIIDDDFAWTDGNWNPPPLSSAIIYELHIGTFTPAGTFESAIAKLDDLIDLGVTHIEIMPVAEFSGAWGWGYDGVDLYAPHHGYGGPIGLKKLVNACHERGLAVLLDVVYNHFGPDGNYLNRFGPYTVDKYHTPWGEAVNLDGPLCSEVRAFFIDNAVMWLRDYHFEGLRLDAVHALIDNGAVHFLEQLSERVQALGAELGRHLTLIAESDLNDPRIVKSREVGGYGIDAQWSDDLHHALHAVITGERSGYYCDFGSLAQLAKALRQSYVYDGSFSQYRERPHGRPPTGLTSDKFVVCIQNHDQIGNRARGERISHLVTRGKARIAAALVLTSPFVPLIFQGEEWAASTPFLYFTQHEDDELARKVSEGRRGEFSAFGWEPEDVPDPQERKTLEASRLRWEERNLPEHRAMLDWYRALIRLRAATPDLRRPDVRADEIDYDEDGSWLVMRRGRVRVACNFSDRPVEAPAAGIERLLLASEDRVRCNGDTVLLPPESVAIVETRAEGDDARAPADLAAAM